MSSPDVDKKSSPNICCLGTNLSGVATCVVIAYKCPDINVVVIDLDPDKIYLWNSKKIPCHEPGMEDLLKKCQNRNLIFTTDNVNAIQEADVIFISVNIPLVKRGKLEVPELSDLEHAARLIASMADKNKIIVEKSNVPVGSTDVLKHILAANKNRKIKFEILSNPEFYTSGTAIKSLLSPERIIIGSDSTKRGMSAAKFLASIYCQWVPKQKIITMKSWSSEITKLSLSALLNQRLSSINTLSIMCEEIGCDVDGVVNILKTSVIGSEPLEPSLGLGDGILLKELKCLIYMLETNKLHEAAEYWRQVLELNNYQQRRFLLKILRSFFLMMRNKKVAIWGFAFKEDTELILGSPVSYICQSLLKEGAKLCIFDPFMEKKQILDELKIGSEEVKNVTVAEDPYKAAYKANAIICCAYWVDYKDLDYYTIYKDMGKPAFVFDGGNYLPHDQLVSTGFVVKAIGKVFSEANTKTYSRFEVAKH